MNILPPLPNKKIQIPTQIQNALEILPAFPEQNQNTLLVDNSTTIQEINITISSPTPEIVTSKSNNEKTATKTQRTSVKKRERTSTVLRACLCCRKKHLKCDGRSPCARCIKSKIECVYEGPKNSPKILKPENQQQFINILINPAPTRKNEIDLYLSNTLQFYINKYHEHQLSEFNEFSNLSTNDLLKQFRQPTKIGMMINAAACSGATSSGQMDLAKEFSQNSRHILREYFDEMDPLVAFTFSTLAMYYQTTNDVQKVGIMFLTRLFRPNIYTGSAKRISQYLFNKDPTCKVNQQLCFQSEMLSFVTNNQDATLQKNIKKVAKTIEKLLSKAAVSGYLRAGIDIFRSDTAMFHQNLETLSNNISRINSIDSTRALLHGTVPLNYTWTAFLYYCHSDFEKSIEIINYTIGLVESQMLGNRTPLVIQLLSVLCLLMGEFELVSKTQNIALRYSQLFPAAKALQQSFPFTNSINILYRLLISLLGPEQISFREQQYEKYLLWKQNGDDSLKIIHPNTQIEQTPNLNNLPVAVNNPTIQINNDSTIQQEIFKSPISMDLNTTNFNLGIENQFVEPVLQLGNDFLSLPTDEYNLFNHSTFTPFD